MLREVRNVRQIPGEPQRRWFSSQEIDLIVWYNAPDSPTGFQLCYNVGSDEKALTWHAPTTYSHTGVDNGEGRPFRFKGTPILVIDGQFDAPTVIELFRREGQQLPSDVIELVIGKLTQYGTNENEQV